MAWTTCVVSVSSLSLSLSRIDCCAILNGTALISGWTLHGNIQAYIDIYVSQTTYTEIGRAFPYLVSKEFASGGGDVCHFTFLLASDAPLNLRLGS